MPELFTGIIGIILFIIALLLVIAAIFAPLFIWGIYNSSRRQEERLQAQLDAQQEGYAQQQRALAAILEANNQQIRILWDERSNKS